METHRTITENYLLTKDYYSINFTKENYRQKNIDYKCKKCNVYLTLYMEFKEFF